MTDQFTESQEATSPRPDLSKTADKEEVDLQKLAERILQLMKEEARIESERQGRQRSWGKKVRHA